MMAGALDVRRTSGTILLALTHTGARSVSHQCCAATAVCIASSAMMDRDLDRRGDRSITSSSARTRAIEHDRVAVYTPLSCHHNAPLTARSRVRCQSLARLEEIHGTCTEFRRASHRHRRRSEGVHACSVQRDNVPGCVQCDAHVSLRCGTTVPRQWIGFVSRPTSAAHRRAQTSMRTRAPACAFVRIRICMSRA
jgi:hypothetical protein